ncbi:hypothetical protein ACFY04_42335 [Streptomyces sp. NPDC001549]|uniref:hypothetical protein n=1 Tax=Streptomyces sp. NPDC001549 TaxID=3364586 RepID=UPI0036CE5260
MEQDGLLSRPRLDLPLCGPVLVMTVSDEEELGEDAEKTAPGRSADQLRGHLGADILAALMQRADAGC